MDRCRWITFKLMDQVYVSSCFSKFLYKWSRELERKVEFRCDLWCLSRSNVENRGETWWVSGANNVIHAPSGVQIYLQICTYIMIDVTWLISILAMEQTGVLKPMKNESVAHADGTCRVSELIKMQTRGCKADQRGPRRAQRSGFASIHELVGVLLGRTR